MACDEAISNAEQLFSPRITLCICTGSKIQKVAQRLKKVLTLLEKMYCVLQISAIGFGS